MAAAAQGRTLVYVGTYGDEEHGVTTAPDAIGCFELDAGTGALTEVGATRGVVNPFYLVIDRTGQYLYAASIAAEGDGAGSEGSVHAFAIDRGTGELKPLNVAASGGVLPCYLSVDRAGQHLLVGNYMSGSVAVLKIEGDGRLGEMTEKVQHAGSGVDPARQDGPHVHSIVLDAAERFALAADLGTDKEWVYAFDGAGGKLTPAAVATVGTAAGAGPRHLAFHPNGRFAYLLNELNSTMTVFEYDAATGGLSEIETLATLPAGYDGDNYAADVKVLSTGDFLYTTNRIHDSIAVFAIDAGTGRATLVGHAGCGGSWPWNLGIDPSGRFLLSANFESGNVVVFEIDRATGMLKQTGHEAAVAHAVNVAFWVG